MVSTKTNEATQRVEKVLDYFVVCEALRNSWERVEVMCKADTGECLHVLIIIHEERDQRMIKYALLHMEWMRVRCSLQPCWRSRGGGAGSLASNGDIRLTSRR